jgi:flagellar basal body-associated protein FliL
MVGETELVKAAQGDFFLTLMAFLVIALVAGFFYFMRSVMDQNTKNNDRLIDRMDQLVTAVTTFQAQTVSTFCSKLEKHDDQAKIILDTQKETLLTLQNRPCIATNGNK